MCGKNVPRMPKTLVLLLLSSWFVTARSAAADRLDQSSITEKIDQVIKPLMQQDNIPGMAVGVVVDGKSSCFSYGVTSRETGQSVTSDTLFELGSISKTFTATLAAYAQVTGALSFSDAASKYLPNLRGSSFDNITLLNLGTHTSGGLPLQVPDEIKDTAGLMAYLKQWQPVFAPGSQRVYSNVSIGLLGMITAEAMHRPFEEAIEKDLLPALGMTRTYIHVPADQMVRYAQGYTGADKPIRVSPGVLSSEAYGVKSTSADMVHFLIDNMDHASVSPVAPEEKWQRALFETHTGYFTASEMTQDLIWEQYTYPVELKKILAGNSSTVIMEATAATQLSVPLPPQGDVLINKTGSTNGFAAYVAFIPAKKLGIVLLANKRYDIDKRVTAAYRILTQLDPAMAPADH